MKKSSLFFAALICFLGIRVHSQNNNFEITKPRHFIGSTVFVSLTPILEPSPNYYQLNLGYRITPKDVLSIEAITWTYQGPLGRPYGPDYENKDSEFPGEVRAYGAGISYKRFLWKNIYTQIHSTAFYQNYIDESDKKIQSGFQLFNTLRFGYHFSLFNNRWFLEPSVAFTYWPINTNLPESFQVEEDIWNNYFLFEPGLHFGYNF